jgi:hypothetical protein
MTKFTENLWRDLAREHGPALAHAERPKPARLGRPRIIAGSTLALAGAGTALALGLTATGNTPAYAVTKASDGSIIVKIDQINSLPHVVNSQLNAIGVQSISIEMGAGAAAVAGAVTCTKGPGVSGPPVKILVGTNGTEVIKSGTTAGNTGVGTWHLDSCMVFSTEGGSGNTGNASMTPARGARVATPNARAVPAGG